MSYDLNEKKTIYARAGIREYWVVNVGDRRVHIFRQPQGDDYQFQSILAQGSIAPEAFPGLMVAIARFW